MKNSTTFSTNTNGRQVPNWDFIYNMLATSDYKGTKVKTGILDELRAAYEEADGFKEAVEDACIVNYLDWDNQNPRQTMRKLINSEVTIALDPRVSAEARKLITLGMEQAIQPTPKADGT